MKIALIHMLMKKDFLLQFQEERLAGVALTLLPMEKCIKETIEYTSQRRAFGRSILDNQVVHFRLAELATEIEALRAFLYKTIGMSAFHHWCLALEFVDNRSRKSMTSSRYQEES